MPRHSSFAGHQSCICNLWNKIEEMQGRKKETTQRPAELVVLFKFVLLISYMNTIHFCSLFYSVVLPLRSFASSGTSLQRCAR